MFSYSQYVCGGPGVTQSRSRSIGAYLTASGEDAHEPVIDQFELAPDDKIVVIASADVWKYMSNQEVADIALHHYGNGNAEGAANSISSQASLHCRIR